MIMAKKMTIVCDFVARENAGIQKCKTLKPKVKSKGQGLLSASEREISTG